MPLRILYKRELKALLKNPSFLVTLILIVVMYGAMGRIAQVTVTTVSEELKNTRIGVIDRDNTELTREVIALMKTFFNNTLREYSDIDEAIKESNVVVVFPEGFTNNMTTMSSGTIYSAVRIAKLSPVLASSLVNLPAQVAGVIKDLVPVAYGRLYNVTLSPNIVIAVERDVYIMNKRVSEKDFQALTGVISLIPLFLAIVVGINASYVSTNTAMEKVEKAFEMLLAQPIPRREVVLAKMLGGITASLIFGLVYLVGILNIITVGTGGVTGEGLGELIGLDTAVYTTLALIIGMVFTSSIGVTIGAIVSDERIASVLATPILLLYIGAGYFISFLGISPDPAGAVISGIVITPIPYIAIVSRIAQTPLIPVISILTSTAMCGAVIWVAFHIFERDIVILGIRLKTPSRKTGRQR